MTSSGTTPSRPDLLVVIRTRPVFQHIACFGASVSVISQPRQRPQRQTAMIPVCSMERAHASTKCVCVVCVSELRALHVCVVSAVPPHPSDITQYALASRRILLFPPDVTARKFSVGIREETWERSAGAKKSKTVANVCVRAISEYLF